MIEVGVEKSDEVLLRDPETGLDLKCLPSTCSNPECSLLHISFEENGERLNPGTFSIDIDMQTWREHRAPLNRSNRRTEIVKAYLSQIPSSVKHGYMALIRRKQASRLLNEYILTPETYYENLLISYPTVLSGDGESQKSLDLGVEQDGFKLWIEDFYCWNPTCRCEEVKLHFIKVGEDPSVQESVGNFNLRFDGSIVDQTGDLKGSELVAELQAEHPEILKTLESRYQEMKKIGKRSRAHYQKKEQEGQETKPRAGRNDPCPCGSGKKYKKCCMRAELPG